VRTTLEGLIVAAVCVDIEHRHARKYPLAQGSWAGAMTLDLQWHVALLPSVAVSPAALCRRSISTWERRIYLGESTRFVLVRSRFWPARAVSRASSVIEGFPGEGSRWPSFSCLLHRHG